MFILTYALNRFKRSIMGSIAITLVSFSFILFFCFLNLSIIQKELQLNEVYDNLEVECVVSNLRGTQTDNLHIKDYIVSLLLSKDSTYLGKKDEIPFSSYVKNLKLKLTLKYELLTDKYEVFIPDMHNAFNLIGLNQVSIDSTFRPENNVNITYYGDNSDAIFLDDKPVCIVSAEIFKTLTKDEDGKSYVNIAVGDPAYNNQKYVKQQLQVVGFYNGEGKSIYCPWEIIKNISIKLTGMISADSLSFTIKDNRLIDSFKELLKRYFANVDNTGGLTDYTVTKILSNYEYSITIYDNSLNKTVSKIKDNINILKIVRPIIYIFNFGIGLIVSIVIIRNRKNEFAIMRSLGTPNGMAFGEAFFELFVLGMLGTMFGLIFYLTWTRFETLPPLGIISLYMFCYLAGSCIVIKFYSKRKFMDF